MPDCTALNCHGSSCASKQTQQNDSSSMTSIESTVASHRSRIREPETRCAPCLQAHLHFQFHLFLDLGHFMFVSTEPPGQRPFGPDTPHILPASSVPGQMAGSETDRFLAKLWEEQQKLLQQNRQNVRNSALGHPKWLLPQTFLHKNLMIM